MGFWNCGEGSAPLCGACIDEQAVALELKSQLAKAAQLLRHEPWDAAKPEDVAEALGLLCGRVERTPPAETIAVWKEVTAAATALLAAIVYGTETDELARIAELSEAIKLSPVESNATRGSGE